MSFQKITEADLAGKGNIGKPDTPELSTLEMQQVLDEIALKVIVPAVNALVDKLNGTGAGGGAGNIGAVAVESGAGNTVQSNIDYILRKLNLHAASPKHIEYGPAEPSPQQADGGVWLQNIDENVRLHVKTNTGYDVRYPETVSAAVRMAGYQKPTKGGAISQADTALSAIGKLEKSLDATGHGDMNKVTYDTEDRGYVDRAVNADKLGGKIPSYYGTAEAVTAAQNTADAAFPRSAGALTGDMESRNIYPVADGQFSLGTTLGRYHFVNSYNTSTKDIYAIDQYGIHVHTDASFFHTFGSGIYVRNLMDTGWAPVNASAFNNQSSERYKKNIVDIGDEELHKILAVLVKRFVYKEDAEERIQTGVIAEQLDEIGLTAPVSYDDDGRPDAVDYSKFTPYLIGMVQEQQNRIAALEKRLAETKQ